MIRRGDIVVVSLAGDYGKPRPAIILQFDRLNELEPDSFIVAPLTTVLSAQPRIRIPVTPTPGNGLAAASEIMTDKLTAVARRRIGPAVGRLEAATLTKLEQEILLVLGFA